jgi:nucleotide-binding universal stress UspA family protein
VSATIMSEYAGKNTRGRMVGAVFANQAAGLVGPLVASIFLVSGLSDNLTWRRTVVAEGDSAESLLIASQNADLLVLGTRGRSPFAGMVLGSVS